MQAHYGVQVEEQPYTSGAFLLANRTRLTAVYINRTFLTGLSLYDMSGRMSAL